MSRHGTGLLSIPRGQGSLTLFAHGLTHRHFSLLCQRPIGPGSPSHSPPASFSLGSSQEPPLSPCCAQADQANSVQKGPCSGSGCLSSFPWHLEMHSRMAGQGKDSGQGVGWTPGRAWPVALTSSSAAGPSLPGSPAWQAPWAPADQARSLLAELEGKRQHVSQALSFSSLHLDQDWRADPQEAPQCLTTQEA